MPLEKVLVDPMLRDRFCVGEFSSSAGSTDYGGSDQVAGRESKLPQSGGYLIGSPVDLGSSIFKVRSLSLDRTAKFP
jgi:hypothetical protein